MGLFSQISSLQPLSLAGGSRVDSCATGCGDIRYDEAYGASSIGLTREQIDTVCVSEFMTRIVTTMVNDACRVTPGLSGPDLGQLDDVWDYLEKKHFLGPEKMAHVYSWKYGGGALLINAADGRKWNEPLELSSVDSVTGFFPIERQYINPSEASSSGAGGWWGPTWGMPRYYQVTPYNSGDARAPDQIASGTIVHPSRVIALPYRRELNLRQAREFQNWNGWGPGIVEGVLDAFEARRVGMGRVGDIMSSFGYDFLEMPGLHESLSQPGGPAKLTNFLQNLKRCRDMTGGGVPVVVTGPDVKITSVNRTVTGLSDLVETQREYLLDSTPYTRVVLFGETKAGLGSGSAGGEWQTHYQLVANYQEQVRWKAIRHAAIVVMAAKDGPTGGRIDFGITSSWDSLEQEKESDRSENRKRNAEAREKDSLVLGIDAKTLALYDPTIDDTYPGLAAAVENGSVELGQSSPGETPQLMASPALGGGDTGGAPGAPGAGGPTEVEGEEVEVKDEIPTDLVSEPEARRLLKCGVRSFLAKIESGDLTPWRLGRSRTYSLAELTTAARGDSYRGDPLGSEHAARQMSPKGLKDFARVTIAPGVTIIRAKRGAKMVDQSVRLSTSEFTEEEARAWLGEHGFSSGNFEAAEPSKGRKDSIRSLSHHAIFTGCRMDSMPEPPIAGYAPILLVDHEASIAPVNSYSLSVEGWRGWSEGEGWICFWPSSGSLGLLWTSRDENGGVIGDPAGVTRRAPFG